MNGLQNCWVRLPLGTVCSARNLALRHQRPGSAFQEGLPRSLPVHTQWLFLAIAVLHLPEASANFSRTLAAFITCPSLLSPDTGRPRTRTLLLSWHECFPQAAGRAALAPPLLCPPGPAPCQAGRRSQVSTRGTRKHQHLPMRPYQASGERA